MFDSSLKIIVLIKINFLKSYEHINVLKRQFKWSSSESSLVGFQEIFRLFHRVYHL